MKTKICTFLVLSLALISCVNQPNEAELAQQLVDSARNCVSENRLEVAKILIDSVHRSYPKLVAKRRQADTLSWHIELHEIERSTHYIDSVLPTKLAERNQLARKFRYEKEEKFQQYGTFTYHILRNDWNIGRSYAKPYVDEVGKLFITAHYCGKPLNFNKLRVSSGNIFSETATISDSDRHTYNDLGTTHETALFSPDKLGSLPDFWTLQADEKVKITFVGKRDFGYNLTADERKAFVETYKLSVVLSDIREMELQTNRNLVRRQILNERLKNEHDN